MTWIPPGPFGPISIQTQLDASGNGNVQFQANGRNARLTRVVVAVATSVKQASVGVYKGQIGTSNFIGTIVSGSTGGIASGQIDLTDGQTVFITWTGGDANAIATATFSGNAISLSDIGNDSITWTDPIAASDGTLIFPALKSNNFVTGVSGWEIDRQGNAEFNDATFRGTVDIIGMNGSEVIIEDQSNTATIALYPENYTQQTNSNITFETGIQNWTAFGGTNVQTNFLPFQGNFCMRVDPDGVSTTCRVESEQVMQATPSQSWKADAEVKTNVTRTITANINWFDVTGTYLSTSNGTPTACTAFTWTAITITANAPASAARASFTINEDATPPVGQMFFVDVAVIRPTLPTDYTILSAAGTIRADSSGIGDYATGSLVLDSPVPITGTGSGNTSEINLSSGSANLTMPARIDLTSDQVNFDTNSVLQHGFPFPGTWVAGGALTASPAGVTSGVEVNQITALTAAGGPVTYQPGCHYRFVVACQTFTTSLTVGPVLSVRKNGTTGATQRFKWARENNTTLTNPYGAELTGEFQVGLSGTVTTNVVVTLAGATGQTVTLFAAADNPALFDIYCMGLTPASKAAYLPVLS